MTSKVELIIYKMYAKEATLKGFIDINDFVKQLRRRKVITWLDRLTFPYILLLWVVVTVSFGFIYHFFSNDISYLFYIPERIPVANIKDSIYFSFVAATTTGLGDIIPYGMFKLIAIFEVIFGLLLLAVVTSKLISIKQNLILSEMYELSISEKINRIRASLLLFRQNLDRIMSKVEDRTIQKRDINSVYIHMSSFEDVLNEAMALITKPNHDQLIKDIDAVNTELILSSIIGSFEKLSEFAAMMNRCRIEWKRDITMNLISRCMLIDDNLFSSFGNSKKAADPSISDLTERKNNAIEKLKNELYKDRYEFKPIRQKNLDKYIRAQAKA